MPKYGWRGNTGKRKAFTNKDIKKLMRVPELKCDQLGLDNPYPGKEENFQKATHEFLSYYDIFKKSAYHIPNERKGDGARIQLSLQGVKPGVSDWCIAIPFKRNGVQYHGMYLELKTESGKLSADQIEFLNTQYELGYYCAVVLNFESFEKLINEAYLFKK